MKYLLIILLTIPFLACNSTPCPPCPPCPECPENEVSICVCKSGFERDASGNCVEITSPQPEDYIALDRAENIIHNVEVESRSEIYLSIWSGVRDEEYAATNCGTAVAGVFNMNSNQLFEMAAAGRDLIDQWENRWKGNLSAVNRRCEENERFCSRTNVRKEYWNPYEDQLKAHRAQANLNRENAQKDPLAACNFDSVAGWCQCRNGEL